MKYITATFLAGWLSLGSAAYAQEECPGIGTVNVPESQDSVSIQLSPQEDARRREHAASYTPLASLHTEKYSKYLLAAVPEEWQFLEGPRQELPTDDQWWTQFDDPILNRLIVLAESRNFDLASTATRIRSAQASLTEARAAWFPTLEAYGNWDRTQTSGLVRGPGSKAAVATDDFFTLGLNLNWQLDIFGKTLDAAKGARASLHASRADYTGAQITLCANVATAYVQYRMYQGLLSIFRTHLANQQKVVAITQSRLDAGIGNKLEVLQAENVYKTTQASMPALESSLEASLFSLSVLTASLPDDLIEMIGPTTPMPIFFGIPPTGIPADLLRRRPDILAAEQQMAVAAANLGIAKKDFLPTLAIAANINTQSHAVKRLFGRYSMGYEVTPQLTWQIFEGFARTARLSANKAAMEAAIDNYNQTVLTAMQEVNTSLSRLGNSQEAVKYYLDLLENSDELLSLSLDLYKRGLTQFSNVVDAQISVLEDESSLVQAKANSLTYAISLYQALGGGY